MVDLWGCDIGWFIWFCAAGKAFFLGIGLLILATVIPLSKRVIWVNLLRYAFIMLGVALVILSATPLNEWIYAVWTVSFLAFLFVVVRPPRGVKRTYLPRIVFVFVCVVALVVELPFHFSPKISRESYGKLYVIGDSVSAGIGGKGERTWPVIFSEKYGAEVTNLSVAGATVGSISPKVAQVVDDNAIVLLEIGGNDLLAQTPQPVFEQSLRFLLQKVVRPNRPLLMLELPLAPWHIRYGSIQRKLAAEFGVILIPKSFLASVLGSKGATIDLAHLSPEGHELMAEKVGYLLGRHLRIKSSQ
jgi:acyl-CoA thioesterase-1